MYKSEGQRPPHERKEERELFFWTAREAIKVGLSLALAIYVVIALASGDNPVFRWLLTGI
jgi:hypothetical protein